MLKRYNTNLLRFIYTLPVLTVCEFFAGRRFYVGAYGVGPLYSSWVHDEATTVVQHIHAGAQVWIAVGFCLYKTRRAAFAISNGAFAKEISCIYTLSSRASVIYDNATSLIGIEFNRSAVSFGGIRFSFFR